MAHTHFTDLFLADNETFAFGNVDTSPDVTMRWDGTDFDILAGTDDYVLKFGNGTKSFDIWVYGNAAADYILWDASGSILKMVGAVALQTIDTRRSMPAATITTVGAATYTAAQFGDGLILRDPNGLARTDTTPTAALLVAEYPGVAVDDVVTVVIVNTADAAETITIAAGTGVTLRGSAAQAFGQNTAKVLYLRFTNVTASSEAVDIIAQ